jgi:plasmid replication initiation protein
MDTPQPDSATIAGQPITELPHFDLAQEKEISGNVTMSRALAESAHGLTLNEARVMMLALRCINPRSSPYQYNRDGYVKVRVHAAEFAELANLSPNADGYTPRAAYEGLKGACAKLYQRTAKWREGKKEIHMRWVFRAEYHDNEAWAEVHFSPDMSQHIFMLGERFVRYRLEFARGLRSVYSTNLLRLLMTQKDTGFKTLTLEDFRTAMEVPETYRYADIKRYAILPAVKELNDKADLYIEWKETKRGRSVHSLQFTFKYVKKAQQTELDLDSDSIQ